MNRNTNILLKSVTAFLLAVTLFACENDIEEVNAIAQKEKFPVETADSIEVIYSDSGRVLMKITAPLMEHYVGDSSYIELSKGVHVIFFNDSLQPQTELTAEYAINKERESIMEAKRNVVVVNEKGDKLNTEHLIWDKNTRMIRTEEFVKITTADEVIMGNGMEADEHFTKYKIKQIKGIISIKENEDENN
jgi:LPS export ABC transporter protein LptC